MKILLTGSNGLVGRNLIPELIAKNHEVIKLVRNKPRDEIELQWSISNGIYDVEKAEGIDAVVHLAGKGIADSRWSERIKRDIRDSRVLGTKSLCDSLKKLKQPPKVFVGASAVGYFGDRGDEILTEESPSGKGFLPEVSIEWENASKEIEGLGTRRVLLRYGVILSKEGGALKKMLPIFKMGVGGKLGSGKQYMSWLSIQDAVGMILFALENENLNGPVNAVSPNPATNAEFTKALGKAIGRPTILPAPAFGLKLIMGEMAQALLLASIRAQPEKLISSDYQFSHDDLTSTLNYCLSDESENLGAEFLIEDKCNVESLGFCIIGHFLNGNVKNGMKIQFEKDGIQLIAFVNQVTTARVIDKDLGNIVIALRFPSENMKRIWEFSNITGVKIKIIN